jgi:hypothetical protein
MMTSRAAPNGPLSTGLARFQCGQPHAAECRPISCLVICRCEKMSWQNRSEKCNDFNGHEVCRVVFLNCRSVRLLLRVPLDQAARRHRLRSGRD